MNDYQLQIILVFFITSLVVIHYFFANKIIQSSSIDKIKFFFPKWNFFNESCRQLHIFLRDDQGHYRYLFPPPRPMLHHLWHFPEGNLYLFYHSKMQALSTFIELNEAVLWHQLQNENVLHETLDFIYYRHRTKQELFEGAKEIVYAIQNQKNDWMLEICFEFPIELLDFNRAEISTRAAQ